MPSAAVRRAETGGDEPPPPVLGVNNPPPAIGAALSLTPPPAEICDYVKIEYGGGVTPIAGGFATFNPVEIIQADVRISNSQFLHNDDGVDNNR